MYSGINVILNIQSGTSIIPKFKVILVHLSRNGEFFYKLF